MQKYISNPVCTKQILFHDIPRVHVSLFSVFFLYKKVSHKQTCVFVDILCHLLFSSLQTGSSFVIYDKG